MRGEVGRRRRQTHRIEGDWRGGEAERDKGGMRRGGEGRSREMQCREALKQG